MRISPISSNSYNQQKGAKRLAHPAFNGILSIKDFNNKIFMVDTDKIKAATTTDYKIRHEIQNSKFGEYIEQHFDAIKLYFEPIIDAEKVLGSNLVNGVKDTEEAWASAGNKMTVSGARFLNISVENFLKAWAKAKKTKDAVVNIGEDFKFILPKETLEVRKRRILNLEDNGKHWDYFGGPELDKIEKEARREYADILSDAYPETFHHLIWK